MSKIFQAPGIVSKISTLVDGGLKVVIDLQEINAQDKARLFEFANLPAWFLLKAEKFEELPSLPEIKIEKGFKTPSERLRGVIFRYWEKRTGQTEDFEIFYKKQMEKIINAYKEKLE